ncbi:afadin- and alpha-actinin-binding protein [Gouania willdenowi]|uniref:afadin- and alpha-actinin-binding protein n=1 Tax=Gouania willdenowi TaxID=441366 RepID=UPI0010568B74|nr:afadin- and alpha-actinin-binding protein-like [Gouania willdenowi]
MLERREAELREAMKLRHSLTTLLHALRVNMEQTFFNSGESCQNDEKSLDQAEVALGEHVTGGVVHSWREVQKRMCLSDGQTTGSTDQDKLLAQLETELKESQQLVRLQQQLLQDSLNETVPSELADSYFLEEWERVRMHWAEFDCQRKTFERERQAFTDAAIRLSREQQEFKLQKASLVKQQYLCKSPSNASNHSSLGMNKSCFNATPTSTQMGTATGRVGVKTPTTPELYSELGLPYNSREGNHDLWDAMTYELLHTPPAPRVDWSFK